MRACFSCSLCDNILRDATTISECLHTFCRKCIYEKITEDEIETCPVCIIDLGCQHKLEQREEELKAATRKELRNGSLAERRVKKEESLLGMSFLESTSSPDTLNKFTQNKRHLKKSCKESFSNKENKDGDEPWDSKLDWKPLNFLVEVANRTKALEVFCFSRKLLLPKRMRTTQRKRSATTLGDSRNLPQPDESSAKQERRNGPVWFSLVASSDQEGGTSLPSNSSKFFENKVVPHYSIMRNSFVGEDNPVSHSMTGMGIFKFLSIQKYLMRKLDLESETEIEVRCMGEAVIPTLTLHKVVDLWLQKSSKHQRFAASIGSSAKEFMMVLDYARKLPESATSKGL
ncbi:Zinc finger RING-type [Arabidopsis suecica]|uniref:Zinc finger RING-type n=1 Tax=Arabidopsis suecica TaxID=45249 RepID=A0A8T1XCJ6_ARASU|nr:Zinc finger RING-type [Arabidopsis suecica]